MPRRGATTLALAFACAVAPLLHACGTARAAGEAAALAAVLAIEAGDVVADVGAGDGGWTVDLAELVGPAGHVYATEVDAEVLEELRVHIAGAGLRNVSVLLGSQTSTGLPDRCCDAILLRMVYHHFTEPAAMRTDLLRALRPGALVAVVDIMPQRHWSDLPGVPDRGGHGIGRPQLLAEMTAAGFEAISSHPSWNGDEDRYCVVFRSPG